ncbi:hypothetical protein FJZ31_14110 [Candidatus Poribacteria bacterium]|nr:hypothetical protein [Candidatus Poribacteria bacterium]
MENKKERKPERITTTRNSYSGYAIEVVRKGKPTQKVAIESAEDVVAFVGGELRLKDREHLLSIHLNVRMQVIGVETVSIGSVDTTIVHPREVFKGAILNGAYSIVLVHNHPSDIPEPSNADVQVTQELIAAGRLLRLPVQGHIIIGGENYLSMAEKGILAF